MSGRASRRPAAGPAGGRGPRLRRLLTGVVALACLGVPATAPAASAGSAVAAGSAGATGAQATRPGVTPSGRWLMDGDGRVLIPHGVAMTLAAAGGVRPADATFLAAEGFDLVRLRVVLPAPAAAHTPATTGGTAVRADAAGGPAGPPAAGAEGVPAAYRAAAPADPVEATVAAVHTFAVAGIRVLLDLSGSRPATGVQATAQAQLRRLDTRLRAEPALLGYLPPAGTDGTPAGWAAAALRADPARPVWRQPPDRFISGVAQLAVGGSRLVAMPGALTTTVPGTVAAPATVSRLAGLADTDAVGWLYEPYACCAQDAPGAAPGVLLDAAAAPTAGNVRADLLDALVRPYPAAVAGVPVAYAYNRHVGAFGLRYRPVPAAADATAGAATGGSAPTEIVAPARRYPTGYTVTVQGGRVTSRPDSGVVCVVAEPGVAEVRVWVRPARAGNAPPVRPGVTASCPGAAARPGSTVAAPAASGGKTGPGDGTDPLLLWVLPLAGAAGMAALLGLVTAAARRRRAA